MTDTDLKSLLEYWQKALRLQDWKITATFEKLAKFPSSSWMGDIEHYFPQMGAKIRIVPPEQISGDGFGCEAPECSLIHELLHLHFQPFMEKDEGPKKDAQEKAINMLSQALYNLREEVRRAPKPLPEGMAE